MAEFLALVHICDVHFHDGTAQRTYAIEQRNRRMRVGSCIENDAVAGKTDFLHLADKLTLYVALIIA